MQINFIGTGGAFDFQLGNSAALLDFRGHRILIDCGNSTYKQLREARLADTIDHILITHLHDDHVGSLSTFLLHSKYFLKASRKANILVPSKSFLDYLCEFLRFSIPNYKDVVTFTDLSEFEGITAVDTYGLHIPEMPSFGYIFEDGEDVYAYSGDLRDPHIIFQTLEAQNYVNKKVKVFHDLNFDPNDSVHCYYKEIIPYLEKYKIYAYHLDPRDNPEDNPIPLLADFPEYLVANNPNLHFNSN
ncbi:MAG: ribonuclease Z [Bacteroidetes bacterium]|nr:ribonuclease Z [Bacteroidota bacterium]MCB0842994.1 ribonuclease Z [Bacteroidota bacterium]